MCQEILSHSGTDTDDGLPDSMVITVARAEVEALQIGKTLTALRNWVEKSSNPRHVRGRLQLRFSGYDSDPRELWEIAEVRHFVRLLDDDFPFWFYPADLRSDLLTLLLFCLSRVSSPRPGATAAHPADVAAFLERHFAAMNQLLEHWQLGEEEIERVSGEITAYFERSRILN